MSDLRTPTDRGWIALSLVILLAVSTAGAEGSSRERITPVLVDSGINDYALDHSPHLTREQRSEIANRLERNSLKLMIEGRLAPNKGATVLLDWPLSAPGWTDPGYHALGGFVDLDPAPGSLLDYNCGTRTYDSEDFNHTGIDYFLTPFAWLMVENSTVQIVSAADGVIIGKDDGNPGQSCSFNSNPWNAVYVEHADGSRAWYGHMKPGSTTVKNVGDPVAAGEYLGVVGSSGNSTWPHLHFEFYDADGILTEPHSGPCNPIASYWRDQRPYIDSAITRVQTGKVPVVYPACPGIPTINRTTQFSLGESVLLTMFYRDLLQGQITQMIIDTPGPVDYSFNHEVAVDYLGESYWTYSFIMPEAGYYSFFVRYEGTFEQILFTYGLPYCGDGVKNTGEVCDDAGDSADCDADCTPAVCGDATTNTAAGETCDDGEFIDGDGCDSSCHLEICGNGFVQLGEVCDDGNLISGDGCSGACELEDNDGDGIPDYDDNCRLTPNTEQDTAYFDGQIYFNSTLFANWTSVQDINHVIGDLSQLSSYTTIRSGFESATKKVSIFDVPPPGAGYWLLVKPRCADSSWSSGGAGECASAGCPVGGRDGNLP